MDLFTLFFLLVLFQIKHYIADFLLQTDFTENKAKKENWLLPLLAHTATHGLFTLLIVASFVPPVIALGLALFDVVLHSITDRLKASKNLFRNVEKTGMAYWYGLGLDQMIHHITHYIIILVVIWQHFS